MLVYESTKADFVSDVENDTITDNIYEVYKEKIGKSPNPQIRSWQNSMQYMYKVLNNSEIPEDAGVAIEFTIPTTAKRIDFILSGFSEEKSESVVIIELKQWEDAEKVEGKENIVKTYVGGGIREVTHPSYQAWSYAALLEDFSEVVQKDEISLYPCAYLHNYRLENSPITDEMYDEIIEKAPLYGKGDVLKLRKFISDYIKYGDNRETLYKIEYGKLRPSKRLQDALLGMLENNEHFIMIDEQEVAYQTAIEMARESYIDDKKRVLIVEGGPGTGKSVVAINLLVNLINDEMTSFYVTKNSAPREVYYKQLKGYKTQNYVKNLFKSSGTFWDAESNVFDAIIVDEAHRLTEKSGMFKKGENQIKEIINSAKTSIFFIDNRQKIHINDIGDINLIEQYAKEYDAEVKHIKLTSQFRCNGSDGYLAWLDDVLQIRDTANYDGFDFDYEFKVLNSPQEVRDIIFEKNKENNKARLLAGYCWDWDKNTREDTDHHDIKIGDFEMSWNLNNTKTWAIDEDSVNEIGCIHTSQGLEFDYVGVILGDDIYFINDEVKTDYNKRAKTDRSLWGIKKLYRENKENALELADEIIKNTYRTLMTRGMKGCYIYCVDENLQEYFKKKIGNN